MSRSLARSLRARWESRTALRAVKKLLRAEPARIWACWDLDNTLVQSGVLLRGGTTLGDAVVEAEPMPNMLEFFAAIEARLPEARHVIVTARMGSMRSATSAWLARHGVAVPPAAVCFVPSAVAKEKIWETLAAGAPLLIVDDLTYGHESDEPVSHRELVETASRTARVYIGFEQIAEMSSSRPSVDAIVSRTVELLRT